MTALAPRARTSSQFAGDWPCRTGKVRASRSARSMQAGGQAAGISLVLSSGTGTEVVRRQATRDQAVRQDGMTILVRSRKPGR